MGQGEGVAVVLLHAQAERLQAAQNQETVLRAGAGAECVLEEADTLGQFRIGRDEGSVRRRRSGR